MDFPNVYNSCLAEKLNVEYFFQYCFETDWLIATRAIKLHVQAHYDMTRYLMRATYYYLTLETD